MFTATTPFYLSFFICSSFFFLQCQSSNFLPSGVGCTKFSDLCSGKGSCVSKENLSTRILTPNIPNSVCICADGWTGVGDLVNMVDTDCGLSVAALRGLFGLACIFCLITLALSLHRLYFSYLSFMENWRAGVRRPTGQRLTVVVSHSSHKSKRCALFRSFLKINVVPLAFMTLLCSIGTLLHASLRVADPTNQEWILNHSWLTTIGRILEVALFFSSCAYFSHSWMTMSILMCHVTGKTREEARLAVRHMKRILLGTLITGSFITPFFVLLIRLMPDFYRDQILTLCYAQSAGIVGLFLTIAVYKTGTSLVDILSKGLECLPSTGQKQRKLVISKITRRFRTSLCTNSITLTLCSAVAWHPELRSKITYLLPVVSTTNQLILAVSLLTLKPPQRAAKERSSAYEDQETPPLEVQRKQTLQKNKSPNSSKAFITSTSSSPDGIGPDATSLNSMEPNEPDLPNSDPELQQLQSISESPLDPPSPDPRLNFLGPQDEITVDPIPKPGHTQEYELLSDDSRNSVSESSSGAHPPLPSRELTNLELYVL